MACKNFSCSASDDCGRSTRDFEPSSLPTIHYLPRTSEILISASHWCVDGMGALQLLNNFFKALGKPRQIKFGDEGRNLSPSLDEIANFPASTNDEEDEAASRLLKKYTSSTPSIGLPTELSNQVPGATRRTELTFTPPITSAIISACQVRTLSVATAFHSALIVATKQLAYSETLARNYTSWGAFDLRPYLRSPYSKPHTPPHLRLCNRAPHLPRPVRLLREHLPAPPLLQAAIIPIGKYTPPILLPQLRQKSDRAIQPPNASSHASADGARSADFGGCGLLF